MDGLLHSPHVVVELLPTKVTTLLLLLISCDTEFRLSVAAISSLLAMMTLAGALLRLVSFQMG